MAIHATAFVDGSAEIGTGVEIGPYCIIGPDVTIGDDTVLRNNVTMLESVKLGAGNEVYPFAVLGGAPQDLKFEGEKTWVEIGDGNVIREYVTVNRGTAHGGGRTVIGDGCLIMAYAHVAHDCLVGDEVIISNAGTLGGHIHVGRGSRVPGRMFEGCFRRPAVHDDGRKPGSREGCQRRGTEAERDVGGIHYGAQGRVHGALQQKGQQGACHGRPGGETRRSE
jgi:carbonic anhydrase/acetyltransferase-like protein (isoleucine patch superfamily)